MENYNKSELYKRLMVATNKVDIWKRIFESVVQNEQNLDQSERINFFVNFMAENLFLYPCKHTESALRVLCMYTRQRWFKGYACNERHIDCILKPLNCLYFLSYNYLDKWDIFLHAMKDGDLQIVKLYVKYGLIGEEKTSYERNLIKYRSLAEFIDFMDYMGVYMFHREEDLNFWSRSAVHKLYQFYPIEFNSNGGNNQRGSGRIYIIIDILCTLILKSEETTEDDNILINNRIQCLNFYYSAMNEPFISQDEIRDFLNLFFADKDNWKEVVEEMINNYRGMFHADSTLVYEPRTLKHQSRCAFRKQLSHQDVSLPYLINQLNIPRVIKEFLLGAPEFRS